MSDQRASSDNSVGSAWLSYMDDVVPKDAPPVQIQECKRAFYAGAWAAMTCLLQATEEHVPEELRDEQIDALFKEVTRFKGHVLTGRQ